MPKGDKFMSRKMERNFQTDDICISMKKQMAIMWKLCDKYPSMDFYRMPGSRESGCRITIMGDDMAEVWTEERRTRKKSIEPDFAGSVISNYVTDEDKVRAIPVNNRDYSALKNKEFGRFAYQSTWRYKWIQFAQTYDDLYKIIEHVILTYSEETGTSLHIERGAYEKENYRIVVNEFLD